MMPGETTQTVREFAYGGAFAPTTLVLFGIALAGIVLLLAWRDGRLLTRLWLTPILVVLRVAAIIVVLWMLAEPAIVTTVRHTKTKSVAVLIDTSGSMGVTDPSDDSNARRWQEASRDPDPSGAPAFVKLDEASASLSVAASDLARAGEIGQVKDAEQRRDLMVQAQESLKLCATKLAETSGIGDDLDRQRAGILDEIKSSAGGKVAALLDEQKSGLTPEQHKEHIDAVETTLAELATRLSRVANAATPPPAQDANPGTRLEKVAGFIGQSQSSWLGEIAKKARVMRYAFDAMAAPVAKSDFKSALLNGRSPTSSATDISAALEQVFRDSAGEPLEAMVIVTDGGHNTDRDPVKTAAAASGTPIFLVPIGQLSPSRDVMLHHVQAPRTAYKDAVVVIDGTIDANGYAGETLHAELLENNQVISTQDLPVSSDTFVRKITFNAKPDQLGRHEYDIRVKPMPEEKIAENNDAKVGVDVVEDKMHVLLADSQPRWEFRYLKNLFRRDEHVIFDMALLGMSDESGAKPPSLPRDLDSWAKYRVVILGDLAPSDLNTQQQEMLEEYVSKRGGTLIVIAGSDAMPSAYANQKFEQLLPVTKAAVPTPSEMPFDMSVTAEGSTNAAVQLTDDLAESQSLWREISAQVPLYGLSTYCKPKPQAHTLIAATLRDQGQFKSNELAFLSWQYYGGGRVVYVSAPYTYRLRQRHGDKYHYQFWGQLLQWAVARDMGTGSKTVKIATDKTRYSPGDEVQVAVQLSQPAGDRVVGATPRVVVRQDATTVTMSDLKEDAAVAGTYRGTLKSLPQGQVTLEVAGKEVDELLSGEGVKEPVKTMIAIDPYDSPELRDTRCNLPLLKQIAEATHGAVLPPTGVAAAMSTLHLNPQTSETVSRRPLWTRWEFLWIFIACLGVEWTLRKLTGLA